MPHGQLAPQHKRISQQVLDMSNFGPAPLAVVPRTLVCQFTFQRIDGEEHYAGRFAGQIQSSF